MKKEASKKSAILRLRTGVFLIFYRLSTILGFESKNVAVFCYHSISNKWNRYSVLLHAFKKEIEKIQKYAEFITLDELVATKKYSSKKAVLTFDDGYRDILQILPFTKKHKIPVGIFVLAEPKHADRKELEYGGAFLSWNEIKILHKEGWVIGCHSATHANLSSLDKKGLQREIVDAKKKLEKKLGFAVQYFAYPKGAYTKETIEAVKKAGYKAAFSVYPSSVTEKTNTYAIPRIVVDNTYSTADFPALYSNAVFFLRRVLGTLAWNLFLKNMKVRTI